jgi:hypothetical protein
LTDVSEALTASIIKAMSKAEREKVGQDVIAVFFSEFKYRITLYHTDDGGSKHL